MPWIWAIWTTPARPMIRRQDRNNLTRGKSTLAKVLRFLTHQACTLVDTQGKGKGGWPINGNCGMKGSWAGPSWTSESCGKAGNGFQIRPWAQSQYGKGFGKKGLNEVSDWSQYVWDLSGIHALTAVPSQAEFAHCSFTKPRSAAAAPWQPVRVRKQIGGAFA